MASSAGQTRRSEYWERLQKRARVSLPLYPEEVYDEDILSVLKSIAQITARSGIAPDIQKLQRWKKCDLDGLRRYVEDLFSLGYVEPVPGGGWAGTEAGFAAIGFEYVKPFLPTNVRLRTRAIAEARRLASLINDPIVLEQFERKYGVDLSKVRGALENPKTEESEED